MLPRAAAADPPPPSTYGQAVQQAYDIIQFAAPQNLTPATNALQVLGAGTGRTQPEIISDLVARPPDYADARNRLLALISALANPATTADPSLAQQRLHQVMSMSRYDALHRPPSLLDRISQWVNDRINALLQLLFGRRGGSQIPGLLLYAIGAVTLLAIAIVVFRAARGRFTEAMPAPPPGPRAAADYFAEADRLAAKNDRVGAIRALCAGVAATLSGERTWEGSPLTVREIFRAAPEAASLGTLLAPFEAAVYGGRDVDEATYERAAQVAARFRRPAEVAA
jgi:hypothetical protein